MSVKINILLDEETKRKSEKQKLEEK